MICSVFSVMLNPAQSISDDSLEQLFAGQMPLLLPSQHIKALKETQSTDCYQGK